MKPRIKHASSPRWPWTYGTECGLIGRQGVTPVLANVTCPRCKAALIERTTKALEPK